MNKQLLTTARPGMKKNTAYEPNDSEMEVLKCTVLNDLVIGSNNFMISTNDDGEPKDSQNVNDDTTGLETQREISSRSEASFNYKNNSWNGFDEVMDSGLMKETEISNASDLSINDEIDDLTGKIQNEIVDPDALESENESLNKSNYYGDISVFRKQKDNHSTNFSPALDIDSVSSKNNVKSSITKNSENRSTIIHLDSLNIDENITISSVPLSLPERKNNVKIVNRELLSAVSNQSDVMCSSSLKIGSKTNGGLEVSLPITGSSNSGSSSNIYHSGVSDNELNESQMPQLSRHSKRLSLRRATVVNSNVLTDSTNDKLNSESGHVVLIPEDTIKLEEFVDESDELPNDKGLKKLIFPEYPNLKINEEFVFNPCCIKLEKLSFPECNSSVTVPIHSNTRRSRRGGMSNPSSPFKQRNRLSNSRLKSTFGRKIVIQRRPPSVSPPKRSESMKKKVLDSSAKHAQNSDITPDRKSRRLSSRIPKNKTVITKRGNLVKDVENIRSASVRTKVSTSEPMNTRASMSPASKKRKLSQGSRSLEGTFNDSNVVVKLPKCDSLVSNEEINEPVSKKSKKVRFSLNSEKRDANKLQNKQDEKLKPRSKTLRKQKECSSPSTKSSNEVKTSIAETEEENVIIDYKRGIANYLEKVDTYRKTILVTYECLCCDQKYHLLEQAKEHVRGHFPGVLTS